MKKFLLLTCAYMMLHLGMAWAQGSSSQLKVLSPTQIYQQQEQAVLGSLKKGESLSDSQLKMLQEAYLKAVGQMKANVNSIQDSSIANESFGSKGIRKITVKDGRWLTESTTYKDDEGKVYKKTTYEYDKKGYMIKEESHNFIYNPDLEIPVYKVVYEYDNDHNMTLQERSEWDVNAKVWVTKSKQVYAFGKYGFQTLMEEYSFDAAEGKLYLSFKSETQYDDNGMIVSSLNMGGKTSASGHFDYGQKTEYSYIYTGNGYMKTSIMSNIGQNDEFVYSTKEETNYNSDGGQCGYALYNWIDGKWKGSYANLTLYDDNGSYAGNYSLSGWNDTYDTWSIGEKSTQKSVRGYWTSYRYTWVPAKKDWVCNYLFDVDVDDEGVLKTMYSYNYAVGDDGTQTLLQSSYKADYSYEGSLTTINDYDWDATSAQWQKGNTTISHRDENGLVDQEEIYNKDNMLTQTIQNNWKYYDFSTSYNDVYLRGTMTNWEALEAYKMKDTHDGLLELTNITIKKGDEFKFADANWLETNWGGSGNLGGIINVNEIVSLVNGGTNLKVQMTADEILVKKMTLNFLTGLLYLEYDASTAVNQVASDGSTITVQGKQIVTKGAKNVKVYAASGQLISQKAVTSVQPGIYMVKADGKTFKVQVK